MHVDVIVCEPEAWLIATRALRPLSMQRPYSAKKSATEADGGVVLGLAGSPTQVAVPPLTTLAHVGEAREVGGGGCGDGSADIQPAQLARLRPLRRGRRGGRGVVGGTTVQLLQHCCTPSPSRGGGDRWQDWCQGGEEGSFHDQG
jgi:hypothetical protein